MLPTVQGAPGYETISTMVQASPVRQCGFSLHNIRRRSPWSHWNHHDDTCLECNSHRNSHHILGANRSWDTFSDPSRIHHHHPHTTHQTTQGGETNLWQEHQHGWRSQQGQVILDTIEDTYILCELHNKYNQYLGVTTRDLLDHLIDRYGKITTADLEVNKACMNEPVNPTQTMSSSSESTVAFSMLTTARFPSLLSRSYKYYLSCGEHLRSLQWCMQNLSQEEICGCQNQTSLQTTLCWRVPQPQRATEGQQIAS